MRYDEHIARLIRETYGPGATNPQTKLRRGYDFLNGNPRPSANAPKAVQS